MINKKRRNDFSQEGATTMKNQLSTVERGTGEMKAKKCSMKGIPKLEQLNDSRN
jgi:hypothetical protein